MTWIENNRKVLLRIILMAFIILFLVELVLLIINGFDPNKVVILQFSGFISKILFIFYCVYELFSLRAAVILVAQTLAVTSLILSFFDLFNFIVIDILAYMVIAFSLPWIIYSKRKNETLNL